MAYYEDLDIWKKSQKFCLFVYKATDKPKYPDRKEIYEKLRELASLLPCIIADGAMDSEIEAYTENLREVVRLISEIKVLLSVSCELSYMEEIELKVAGSLLQALENEILGMMVILKNVVLFPFSASFIR